MMKHFATLFVFFSVLALASSHAQTYTYNTGTAWQNSAVNGTWIQGGGATGYPGLIANNGNVTLSPTVALTFADVPPVFAISSLTMSGTQPVTLGVGVLTITNTFTLNAGATLNIPAGTTVVVNGTSTIGGIINLQTATSRIIFNSAVTQTGTGVINAAAAAATVQFGAGVTSVAGTLFQNPFGGRIQTGGAMALTANLTLGAAGTLSLSGDFTVNSGVTLTVNNTAAMTTVFPGAGTLQGTDGTAIISFATGPTVLQGTRFSNPFNGRLNTSTAGASSLTGAFTLGSTGILNLGQQLNPVAGTTIILNNTAANSLTGVATGRINIINNVIVNLGVGFNNGVLDGDRFLNPITGALNTASSLTATGTATPILQFNNTNGVFNITGTLSIASGKTIFMNNTAAGSLPGTGHFAATDNTSILRFVAAANGGNVSGSIFSNPWNGRLRLEGVLQLGTNLGAVGSSVLNAGPNAIFDLNGILTVNDSLALNCTQTEALAFQGGASRIVALAGGPSTGAPGPGGRVAIGANTFNNFVPVARLGTGTTWAAGNLFILGTSILNVSYTINNGTFLFLNPGIVLTVAATRTLALNGRILGTGRINGQDNTAIVSLGATFSFGNPSSTDLPGANFGNPNFDGRLTIVQGRTLSGSLRMGVSSIYDNATFTTTINAADTLYLNQTASTGLTGIGTFVGAGTLNFGNAALNNTFPAANVPSGTAPANFGGRIILGDGVNFAANYNVLSSTLLQLNGTSTVNSGVTLTVTNTAANTINGTGRLQAQSATSIITFGAAANGGIVPGANIATGYVGRINTTGAMNLTGNLSMGATSVLSLGGNLTLNPTSQVTLGMSAAPASALLGAGLLVGQPTGAGTPEIILANGALTGQVPGVTKILTGSGTAQFGGRLTVGTGYAITSNTAINQPAILNIQTGAQLLVNAGNTLSLNTTNSPATGTGTGTIQGQNNTAIVSLGNGFNGSTVPGTLFASPYAGQLVIPSGGLTQSGTLTMGATSILQLNGNLTVNPAATLTLSGGASSVLSSGGLLNGTNTQSVIALSAGFNGGTIPANRFASPLNGAVTTAGAMTLSGALTFGSASSLALGGDVTIPAATTLYLGMTGANALTGTGRFIAAAASSQVSLAPGFNNTLIPGTPFTSFGGIVAMNSSMNLGSSLALGTTGALDIGGGSNTLSLGESSLLVATAIRGTTSTAFVVTNGSGALTINNTALTSVFFPIGTSPSSYSPLTISNSSTPDIFTVRARPGITNSAATYPNYVNIEWLISQAGAGNRNLTFVPQWTSANQRGTNFLSRAVGLSLFINNQYVESATAASLAVSGGGYFSTSATFNATFSNTPLVVFSKIVLPPVQSVQPRVSNFTPLTFPVSNDDFSITFTGTNLNTVRTITAQNLTSNVTLSGTIVGTALGGLLTVNFPGILRGISGTLRLSLSSGIGPDATTTAQVTITPVASPTLTALAPSTTASGRAFTLNLTGTGFLSQARLSVNSTPVLTMSTITATFAALEVPAIFNNTAATVRIRLTNTDGQFAELPYVISQAARPSITSISPRAVFAGTNGVTIAIEGSGFFGAGFIRARFGSALVDVNVISSTRISISVPANLLTTTGFPDIFITNSDAESIGYVFSILERAAPGATPVITSYSPTSTTASSRAYSVVVNGSNFNPRALVTVRGTLVTPRALDTNRLVVEVPAGLNAAPASLDIVLQNPDLQATTATVAVGAMLPAPVLNSFSPQTTTGGISPGRPFTITISGTNFTTGASVLFNGQSLPIAAQSSTSIRAIVPTNSLQQSLLSPDGINSIIILNGDGQTTPPATYIISAPSSVLDNSLPNFSVYPSPVSDVLTIKGSFERPSRVHISVSNVLGERVMQWDEQGTFGQYNRQVDMTLLPSGAYIVEINHGARRFVQKIMKL